MTRLFMFVTALFICSGTANAQSEEDLQMIMKGWAEKRFEILVGSELDQETGKWKASEDVGSTWDVKPVSPTSGHFSGIDGSKDDEFYVELADKLYTNYWINDAGEREVRVHKLVKANVFGPNHWTIFVEWKKSSEDSSQRYAEMYMAGNIFVRTDFEDVPGSDQRRRIGFWPNRQID